MYDLYRVSHLAVWLLQINKLYLLTYWKFKHHLKTCLFDPYHISATTWWLPAPQDSAVIADVRHVHLVSYAASRLWCGVCLRVYDQLGVGVQPVGAGTRRPVHETDALRRHAGSGRRHRRCTYGTDSERSSKCHAHCPGRTRKFCSSVSLIAAAAVTATATTARCFGTSVV